MRVLCYGVQGLGGGLSQKTHRVVLAAFGGGAVARRVVGVGAWGGAPALVIGASELSLLAFPSSELLLGPLLLVRCGLLGHQAAVVAEESLGLWALLYSLGVRAPSMADGADGWRCAVGIERYRGRGWFARKLGGRGAKGTGPGDSRDPGPTPVTLVRSRSEAVPTWGGRQHCAWVWLTRGVQW